MSGHSKWHSIRHKKGAADARRGKIFTRHANLITIAARQGGDPTMNPLLRLAIDNAKKENVPNDNIERAIKRGTGELKDGSEISEVTYEGYGPAGTAVMVECLTDNKNRTYTNVRTVFNKRGGNLGNSGSVAWMFKRRGVIQAEANDQSLEDIEMAAIESGAEDIKTEGGNVEIYTDPSELNEIAERMKAQGIHFKQAEVLMVPDNTVRIESPEDAKKILDFMEALDDDPDVSNVSGNFDIPDEIMEGL